MGNLSYSLPVVGNPNSTEDPKIATALQQIQAVVNPVIADSGWITPSFLNSWGYATGQLNKGYRKIGNQVFFALSISGGASGTAVFTIPSSYAPSGAGLTQITGSSQIGTNDGLCALTIPAGGGSVTLYSYLIAGANGFWAFYGSYLVD